MSAAPHITVIEPLGGSAFVRADTAAELGIIPRQRLTQAQWDAARFLDWQRNRDDRKRA